MRIIFLSTICILLILPSIVFSVVSTAYDSGPVTHDELRQPAPYELAASDHDADEQGIEDAGEEVLKIQGTSDAEKRLDEIELRKKELAKEKEKLIKNRQQLYDDVEEKGIVKTQAEFDALKKRISELEKLIKQFNDEVKTLTEEEQRLIDLVNKEQEAQ
ncbi:MAG: hypothetical protein JSV13_00960 [Nitrospiraceae bacterium]|nr:MAG: hypothetical protein JSV13_00960 [Nitrospiraceae bacterium]